MIKLYGPARSSAGRCLWVLEELGIQYENINIDLMKKEQLEDWFLAINPNGKVPALVDGDVTLFESFAINYYLSEKYNQLFTGKTLQEKAITQQWSFWVATELQSPMIEILIQKKFIPEDKKNLKLIDDNEKLLPLLFKVLETSLADKKFLNGELFTLADLNVASVVSIAHPIGFDLTPYKNITNWMRAISERASFQRYMALRK